MCLKGMNLYGYDKNKVTLKDVKLHERKTNINNDKEYYLELTYEIETLEHVMEAHIPKAILPLNVCDDLLLSDHPYCGGSIAFNSECRLSLGNSDWTCKVIKEKTKEMTLEEIEKKLGHKVKIISNKGE